MRLPRRNRNLWLATILIMIGAVLEIPGDQRHHLHEPWFAAGLIVFFLGIGFFLWIILREK